MAQLMGQVTSKGQVTQPGPCLDLHLYAAQDVPAPLQEVGLARPRLLIIGENPPQDLFAQSQNTRVG